MKRDPAVEAVLAASKAINNLHAEMAKVIEAKAAEINAIWRQVQK